MKFTLDEPASVVPTQLFELPYKKPAILALHRRGIISEKNATDQNQKAVEAFLNPDYKLADPFLFKNMKQIVERVGAAIKNKEKIVIYGDYDVDGLSASALLLDLLNNLGADVEIFIPSRHEYGYGLRVEALDELIKKAAKLVITVDCGVTAYDEVEHAKSLGLDIIVTDHHALPEKSPRTLILHPLVASDYPFEGFSGAGVAFILARALIKEMAAERAEHFEKWLLDLAMLGTISDVVPLVGENRIIAKFGLLVLSKTRRPGLKAILREARDKNINERTVGWVIAPRLNASGRLKHALESIEILTTTDNEKALKLAADLNEMNTERRSITERMVNAAREEISKVGERSAYVVSSKEFNHGVAGIVAARLSEEFGRPVLICEEMETGHKGSARAPKGYNLIENLRAASHCFTALGGHAGAAGFTVYTEMLHELNAHIDHAFAERPEAGLEVLGQLTVADATIQAAEELSYLAPFGFANEEPIFSWKGNAKFVKSVGADKKHIKFSLIEAANFVDVIGFGLADRQLVEGDEIEVIGTLEVNEFMGKRRPQIKALEIHPLSS